jgi:predicted membrane-bound mannosyltransferase
VTGAGPATDLQVAANVRRACLLLLLFGAMLRGTGLGVHSLWCDELMTVWVAWQPELTRVLAADRSPPLAFLLFSIWVHLFGEHDVVLRLLPALVSTATSWPRFEQLDTAWIVVSKEPMRLRVQYLLLQRRRG